MQYLAAQTLAKYFRRSPLRSEIGPWLREFLEYLRAQALPYQIRFQFAEEWYYIEGTNTIALPFYLADRSLARQLANQGAHVEGTDKKTFLRLLRHEYGHFFEAAYQTRRLARRRQLFGSNPKYPTAYLPRQQKFEFVEHLPNQYAQSHPDEDFAETFALVLGNKKAAQLYPPTSLARQKILFVSELIEARRHRPTKSLFDQAISLPGAQKSLQTWCRQNQKTTTQIQHFEPIANLHWPMNIDPWEKNLLSQSLALYLNGSRKQVGGRLKRPLPQNPNRLLQQIRRQKLHYIPM